MQTVHDPAPRRPLSKGEQRGIAVFAGLLVLLLLAELASGRDPRKLSVLFILISWGPLLVLHELGHALVARAVGWRVHEIMLGLGPRLARFELWGVRLTLRLVPAGGYVVPAPRNLRHARVKSALIYAAGPLAELLVPAWLLLWLGSDTLLVPSDRLPLLAAQSLALAALMGGLLNLLPTRAAGAVSDGLGLLLSLRSSPDHFRYLMARPFMGEAQRRLDAGEAQAALTLIDRALAGDPESPFLPAMRARCLAELDQIDAALSELQRLRAQPRWSDLAEAERLHAAACVALRGGDPSLQCEGEQACRAALERAPAAPDMLLTHGALLLAQGRAAEAEAQLQQAYARSAGADLEARCLALLAQAAERLGKNEDAQRFREALARCKGGSLRR